MVIDNPFEPVNTPSSKANSFGALREFGAGRVGAPFIERVLSFIIDMAMLWPLAQLILSPIRQQLSNLALTGYLNFELLSVGFIYLGALLLLLSFTHALFYSMLGASPGQFILRLQVVSNEDGKKLSFLRSWLRSGLMYLSLLFFGWPLIGALAHHQRRTFHDLATDSWVTSKRNEFKKAAVYTEAALYRPLVRSFYITSTGLMLAVLLLMGAALYEKSNLKVFSFLEEVKPYCEDLPEGSGFYDSALAAYLVEAASDECLLSFSDQIFASSQEDQHWGFLAKYFVLKNEGELRAQYEKALCQDMESEGCQILQLYRGEGLVTETAKSLTYKIAAIHQLNMRGLFKEAKALADKLPVHKAFSRIKSEASILARATQLEQLADFSIDLALDVYKKHYDQEWEIGLSQGLCDIELSKECAPKKYEHCQKLANNKNYLVTTDAVEFSMRALRLSHYSACSKNALPLSPQAFSGLPKEIRRASEIMLKGHELTPKQIVLELESLHKISSPAALSEHARARVYQYLTQQKKLMSSLPSVTAQVDADFKKRWSHAINWSQEPTRGLASEPTFTESP